MNEPKWLRLEAVEGLHDRSLSVFGGSAGVRDSNLLEMAMARPRNHFVYEESATISSCAAAYASGFARNHPFVDGNKRAAFLSLILFLRINGITFRFDPIEAINMITALAAGEISEEQLIEWVERRSATKAHKATLAAAVDLSNANPENG